MLQKFKWLSAFAATSILSASTNVVSALEAPEGHEQYKIWLNNLSDDEKREHFNSKTEEFTEEFGEDANDLRLCLNLDQDWGGWDLWVDQRWRKVGVKYLDNKRYNDWISNANKGEKPWLVMFAYTPIA